MYELISCIPKFRGMIAAVCRRLLRQEREHDQRNDCRERKDIWQSPRDHVEMDLTLCFTSQRFMIMSHEIHSIAIAVIRAIKSFLDNQ